MPRYAVLLCILIACVFPARSQAQSLTGPEARLDHNDLYVTFTLSLDDRRLEELRNGIEKELTLYIDLFRVWARWPDEFVLGKSYTRTIKADPIKKEYVATSNDGSVMTIKRFKSFESMTSWGLSVKDLKLTNTRELEPGKYFVKVTVASRIRKLPPVIGYLFLFVSENEFKIEKDSPVFLLEAGQ